MSEPTNSLRPGNVGTPPRRIRVVRGGPVLIEGPVTIEMPDGRTVTSDRFVVAVCACGGSRTYPLCDSSHRRCRHTS